jgi:hypothetical protein
MNLLDMLIELRDVDRAAWEKLSGEIPHARIYDECDNKLERIQAHPWFRSYEAMDLTVRVWCRLPSAYADRYKNSIILDNDGS